MPEIWPLSFGESILTVVFLVSTAITIFMITAPSQYSHFQPDEIVEADFTEKDKQSPERSGYNYFLKHQNSEQKLRTDTTVQVVVLGDIGRSPRTQYHALSIAEHGGRVHLVGYVDSEVHPDVEQHRFITVLPIRPFPKWLQTSNKFLFLLFGPLKILWQIWSLYYALGYRTEPHKWMLVQNPPSIPTLAVAQIICFLRRTYLVIDWHNFGYSILEMKLGPTHPFVKVSERYERFFARGGTAHFAVTDAMVRVLRQKWGINAIRLRDRPPKYFQPLSAKSRHDFLKRLPELLPETAPLYADGSEPQAWRLIVSSTSWTQDEDFSILLEALVTYSTRVEESTSLPKILAIITGKGPQKQHYLKEIRKLTHEKKLKNVLITTAWLSPEDYASLLGAADLGISLHTSSSGVDLPMKVVDMFGAGLPVLGWSKFEAWPELVKEGENGFGFDSAASLAVLLEKLFAGHDNKMEVLREGALKESSWRWNDEWAPKAGKLFQLKT